MGKADRRRRKRERAGRESPAAGAAPKARPGGGPEGGGPARTRAASEDGALPDKDLAAAVIAEALRALSAGDRDAYSGWLTQLADERTPGWTRAVSDGLVEFLRVSVRAVWRQGWQPAELARQVSRALSAEHARMVADLMADEMRGYASATVDPGWAAQVAALGALPPGEAGFMDAWRLANLAGLRGAVANAAETLQVLGRLPALERLLPLPGTARPAAHQAAHGANEGALPADERVLGRIRALLAKAEATEFAQEAEALSARAQQLMAKYSIDHALLTARDGHQETPGGRRLPVDPPYEAPKVTLLQTVAQANRCRTVWLRELGLVTVIGFPPDLDATELLFTSLLVQASSAMLRAGASKDTGGRPRSRAFRQSFLVSYAVRIGERLAEAAGQAEREAVAEQAGTMPPGAGPPGAGPGGKDLVPFLAARNRAVDDAVDAMFGGALTRSRAVRVDDADGWHSGRAAANLASLHNRTPVE
jgi:hypothetical protein